MSSSSDSLIPSIRAEFIIFIVLIIIVIVLRFWSAIVVRGAASRGLQRVLWWDDWIALVSAIFCLIQLGVMFHWSTIGLGTHADSVSPEHLVEGRKLLYVLEILYDCAISFPKLAALFFYARVLGINRRFKMWLWVTGGLILAWWVSAILTAIFQCTPVERAWLPDAPGVCINFGYWYMLTCLASVLIDLIVLIMPLPLIWKLQLKPMKKLGVTLVFVSGYLVAGISIGRLIEVAKQGQALENDLTYNIIAPGYFMAAEGPVSVISVCLPNIYSLVSRAVHQGPMSIFGSAFASRGRTTANSYLLVKGSRTAESGHRRQGSNDGPLLSSSGKSPGYTVHAERVSPHSLSPDRTITEPTPVARGLRKTTF